MSYKYNKKVNDINDILSTLFGNDGYNTHTHTQRYCTTQKKRNVYRLRYCEKL